jgi:hypothetical protein
MIEIGNGGMSEIEHRTHILLNREVIAVDQGPLGKQARRVIRDGDKEIGGRPLASGESSLGLFNRGSTARYIRPGDYVVVMVDNHATRRIVSQRCAQLDDACPKNDRAHPLWRPRLSMSQADSDPLRGRSIGESIPRRLRPPATGPYPHS